MKTRIKLGTILEVVADYYGIDKRDILKSCRQPHLILPRHMAMYLAYKHCGLTNNKPAGYFNKEESTVRLARYEIRDNKWLVADISRLEKLCLDAFRVQKIKEEYKAHRLMKSRRISRTPFIILRRGGGVLRRKHVYGGGK